MKTQILILTALTALSACGGSGTPVTEKPEPTTRSAGAFSEDIVTTNVPDSITVDYSQATDQFTFASNGTPLNGLVRRQVQDNGAALGFRDANNDLFGFAHRSDSGQVAVVGGDRTGFNHRGALLERFGTATVPLTGAATFTGDYAGLIGQETPTGSTSDVRHIVNGDVTIGADFANNTVSGAITNREIRNENNDLRNYTANDVTLNPTTLDGAIRFSGVASGGEIQGGSTSNGRYAGSINGAQGDELLGVLTMDQNFNNQANTEWGIIVTNR